MRQSSVNYLFGSLFSRQFWWAIVQAYAFSGGVTTGFQIILIQFDILAFTNLPRSSDELLYYVDLYIETVLPMWVGEISRWNVVLLISNAFSFLILFSWTMKYVSPH